ncbi:MAG TPA: thymidine phosphorylase [Acidimicrobiia bacterium]|nr:thymidine phosphorylase [Acidimicrobiia bacterium]
MNFVELIERKRDGGTLIPEEIRWIIESYTAGAIPDYQMSALVMAVFIRGLDDDELAAWTAAMLHSGAVLDLSGLDRPAVDKHSTGGVGDKVSIPLAPMVAACGVAIPMISGRGLGHTGGTLDKLETIPGFRTALDPDEFKHRLFRHGLVLAGQSESIAPADRLIYALRDATGTVPSIPLIASSIMSKKVAEGIEALVLDVKVGRGSFNRTVEIARTLAETMVGIGTGYGVTTVAYLTDMSQPLGREVGNACEIEESVGVLRGDGPPDLVEVVSLLGAEMLLLAGLSDDTASARERLTEALESGAALEKFIEVVEAQGGDPAVIEDTSLLPRAPGEHVITARATGTVARCDALDIGIAGMRLGAGRETKESTIHPGVGITVEAKVGDAVETGDPLARLRYDDDARLPEVIALVERAFIIQDEPAEVPPLLHEVVR